MEYHRMAGTKRPDDQEKAAFKPVFTEEAMAKTSIG